LQYLWQTVTPTSSINGIVRETRIERTKDAHLISHWQRNRYSVIIHVDMDAFYASIEERDQPELVGKPVIVGGSPDGRGVVAAANYAIRKFGVHSAMPTSTALRLCPQAIVLPVRMNHYAAISRQLREVFHRFTPLVEPLAFDEAFLDVSGSLKLFGEAEVIGHRIKNEIQQEVNLVASVGIAPNKFLAKLASDLDKPNGFVKVDPQRVQEFLDDLPVGRIWGVGKVTGKSFQQIGIKTIGQLRLLSREILDARFGPRSGEHLWKLARGIDDREVVPDRNAKSISHETTFATDINDKEALRSWLMELTEQVGIRLRRHKLRCRTVHLKIRYDDFSTFTRSQAVEEPTNSTDLLWRIAVKMLNERLPNRKLSIRLIGMGVSGIDTSTLKQKTLFDEETNETESKIDEVTDLIQEKFGNKSVSRGRSFGSHRDKSKHRGNGEQ
jgi:DNA polymerase-4